MTQQREKQTMQNENGDNEEDKYNTNGKYELTQPHDSVIFPRGWWLFFPEICGRNLLIVVFQ